MPAARTLQPEDEVSHYRIVGPLGAGGMGEVYLAQDRSLERNVALKILPAELVQNPERVRRFELEAKSASSLNHPNIVTIYEIGQDEVRAAHAPAAEPGSGAVRYISMELVSGETLGVKIHEERTDLRTLLGWLAQAAEGIAKAHAAGIVHRDLKPGNIMVSKDGFAKVLDFGLAKLTERREADPGATGTMTLDGEVTGGGTILGTVGYMAPEQVQGKPVDHRADIFSFGCILYEAATRQRPFAADSGVESMHRILHDKPAPIEEINSAVPAELRRLIRRCLAKNPEQRLQSMKDVAIELREMVEEFDALSASASSSSAAGLSGAPAAAPRAGRRLPMPVLAGGAIAVVAVVALGFWALRQQGRVAGPQSFQTMKMTTQTTRGDVAEAAISADGRYLAYVASRAGKSSVHVLQVATGSDVEVLPTVDASLRGISFSPDGNYLSYLRPDEAKPIYSALYQMPSLGGPSQQKVFDVDTRASFSPDGKQVVFRRGSPQFGEDRLIVYDFGAGKERVLSAIRQPDVFNSPPAWSPDGRRIAALIFQVPPTFRSIIAIFDVASGKREDFESFDHAVLDGLAWLADGSGLVFTGVGVDGAISNQVGMIAYPGRQRSRVTNDFNNYSDPTASGGEEAIAAVRRTRLSNLSLVPAGGGAARALTAVTSPEDSPGNARAVDDSNVLFQAMNGGVLQVWTVPAGGGAPRALTTGDEHVVVLQTYRGGAAFLRWGGGALSLWTMRADGSGLRLVTDKEVSGQLTDVSPDGRYAAMASGDSIVQAQLVSLADGRRRVIPGSRSGVGMFSPDGKSILVSDYETLPDGSIQPHYLVVPVEGDRPTAEFSLQVPTGIRWAADSQAITYGNRADPAWNIYRQPIDGSAPTQVTRFTEGRILQEAWSPDGAKLAVVRAINGIANVWVTDVTGGNPVQVTDLPGGQIFSAEWMPDGSSLVINAGTISANAVLIRDFR